MFEVFDYCKTKEILPLCTPWDKDSLGELEAYGLQAYKLASADLTNHDLIEAVIHTGKPIIASTGMSSESEIKDAVSILKKHNAKFVLLHCNSTYPAPFKDINLNYMERLKELASCPVGYSGHERSYAVVIAAVAKGACVIEKHFTLDRNMEGNDHRVSLLPNEFKAMVQSIREVEQALGSRDVRRITQGEMMNREVLAKSLIINCELNAGEKITAEMIDVRSPGNGLSPYRKNELIGQYARRSFKSGDFFFPSDIDEGRTEGRNFKFNRPFGIPVRYHDFSKLAVQSNLDLLEFHLSYKDMDESPEAFLKHVIDMDVVVHSPDLFAGDHILDLCTPNLEHRRRSIAELKRVVEVAKRIKHFFKRATRPLIILNAGGWTQDAFLPESERDKLHDLVAESLSEIDQTEVEIIPQTMPPFPWHFGGQRYCNIFMFDKDIERFCKKYGYRICLDVSHSALTCNHFGVSFRDFLDRVTSYSAHHHIVDASGSDGEGLQIGEGQIDFGMVADMLNKHAPKASFIPEIWQGHKNDGEGFWIALNRLEKWL
jgi:N-acetylneuraminate synthase